MVMFNIKFYCINVDGSVSVELIANNDKFIFGVKPTRVGEGHVCAAVSTVLAAGSSSGRDIL